MNLWLDDTRDPMTYGENFVVKDMATKVLLTFGRESWTWVKTVEECKQLLAVGGIDIASFDNDLGTKEEGYMVLNWLEEKAATETSFPIPNKMYVHSHNVDRVPIMRKTIENIYLIKSKSIIQQN